MPTLKELVKRLPPDLEEEVRDFAEFLLEKWRKREKGEPSFEWAGALKDLRDKYTSVELQHQVTEWRLGKQ